MKDFFRCNCPITSAVDIVGDKWSLVVIKQMLFEGKSTFTDFTESTEAIATNILASRLKSLGEFGILKKTKRPENKKTNIYYLTDKGLALTPTIMELTFWSKDHLQEFHTDLNLSTELNQAQKNKEVSYKKIVSDYKKWRREIIPV